MRVFLLLTLFCSVCTLPSLAKALDLDPPSLAWEPKPQKKKIDNTQYWREKYGIKEPKPEVKNKEKIRAPEHPNSTDGYASEGAPESDVSGGRIGNTDGSPAAKITVPYQGDDVSDKVFLKPKKCNFSNAIGKNIKDIDFGLFKDRPVRVIYPDMAVTQDYSPDRVNLSVKKDGTIVGISCN